jgi:gluconokinase
MQYTIGIDIGTGSVKGVALDADCNLLARSQSFYPANALRSGISEQDPLVITRHFIICLEDIIQQLKQPPALVSFSSYMHGIMAVDEQCSPITNLITWADTRSESIAEGIRNSKDAETIYKTTGAPIHSMLPLCKIIWWQQHEPGICQRAYKFISIKEYIWYQLFHSFQADHSIANATGLFDIQKREWSTASLQLCGIVREQLSELVPTNYIRKDIHPQAASLINIPQHTPFCIGSSDGCLAVIGSGALEEDIASLTIGTSGAVRLLHAEPIYKYPEMIFSYILEESTYVCGGPVNNGGNVVQWLLKQFWLSPVTGKDEYEALFKNIELIPAGSEGLIFLPYLYGERAPVWDEKACGAFLGVREHHTHSYFLKAVLEGICFGLNDVIKVLESTVSIKQINVSGGFTHSKEWMQLLADITGKPVYLLQSEDASATGAALLGMKANNQIKKYTAISGSELPVLVTPNENNHQFYRKLFPIYKDFYSGVKKSMHLLYNPEH